MNKQHELLNVKHDSRTSISGIMVVYNGCQFTRMAPNIEIEIREAFGAPLAWHFA